MRVYSQGAYGYMQAVNGSYDCMWTTVTMDNGMLVVLGGGWNLPPSYPEFLRHLDRDHRHRGRADPRRHPPGQLAQHGRGRHRNIPMSTMPGEQVDHVFAGQMGPETIHFLESVSCWTGPSWSRPSTRAW